MSLKVLSILNITGKEQLTVSVGMYVPSKRLGFKDVVKIERDSFRNEKSVFLIFF